MEVHLGVWVFILTLSHTSGLLPWPALLQALALVASPTLGLRQMRQRPYNQWLNIQHFFFLCFYQIFFYFYSFQQFHFLLVPSFVLTFLPFFFHCYLISTLILLWTLKLQKTRTTSNNKHKLLLTITSFFLVLKHHAYDIHFFIYPPSLINAWSSKLIRPITTTLCVPCTTTWKHLSSSLWMNVANFIFWLLHIHNLSTLFALIPFHSPCTPFANYAHLCVDYENTYGDYTDFSANYVDFSVDYAQNFDDYVNTPDDRIKTTIDSADTLNISSSYFYIPNTTLL